MKEALKSDQTVSSVIPMARVTLAATGSLHLMAGVTLAATGSLTLMA